MAEIAARARLTKRTFFNHFADKREVFFEGAKALEATVVHQLDEAAGDLDPLDAAVFALTGAGDELAKYGAFGRIRRELIASSTDLQERELIKVAALSAAIAAGLRRRQVPARNATFIAHAAVTVFTAACDDWIDDNTADFSDLMQHR